MIRNFILWNTETNQPCGGTAVADPSQLYMPDSDTCQWYEIEGDIRTKTLSLVDGKLTEVDRAPHPDIAMAAKRLSLYKMGQAFFDVVTTGSCQTSIGIVQCDKESRDNMLAEAVVATRWRQEGKPYVMAWRLTNNQFSSTMDATKMIEFAEEVRAFYYGCLQRLWQLKSQIDNPNATMEDLEAIDPTAGYPEGTILDL